MKWQEYDKAQLPKISSINRVLKNWNKQNENNMKKLIGLQVREEKTNKKLNSNGLIDMQRLMMRIW